MPTRRPFPTTDRSVPSRAVVKQSTPVGRECALVLPAASGQALALSYWDLWFALVADADFEGSWERFVEHLRLQKNQGGSRRLAELKLSHLRELERRLWQADVTISAIVAQVDQLPVELRRARNQILTREPREYEWSDAMRHPPRQRHYAYALRGFWPCFPVSPASYAERLASQFHTRRWFSENQSFGLARKLDAFLDDVASLIPQAQYAQVHAMLRAFDDLDFANLCGDVAAAEPAIDDADTALLGLNDGHGRAGNRVHIRRHDRMLQDEVLGEARR